MQDITERTSIRVFSSYRDYFQSHETLPVLHNVLSYRQLSLSQSLNLARLDGFAGLPLDTLISRANSL